MSDFDDKHTMSKAEFAEKFGATMDKFRAAIPQAPTLESLASENQRLREALGTAACSLDCMTNLSTRNEYHRDHARAAIRHAMGA